MVDTAGTAERSTGLLGVEMGRLAWEVDLVACFGEDGEFGATGFCDDCGLGRFVGCRTDVILVLVVTEAGVIRAPWSGSRGGSTSGSISSLVIAKDGRRQSAGAHWTSG